MNVLFLGGSKSGKSALAQNCVHKLYSASNTFSQNNLYYLATMIPHDAEDEYRIQKHRENRNGMGFTTIEGALDIEKIRTNINKGDSILLDSITALLSEKMFSQNGGVNDCAGEDVFNTLCFLVDYMRPGNAVFVCDYIFSDGNVYSETTNMYIESLAFCIKELSVLCDCVVECVSGVPCVLKGELPFALSRRLDGTKEEARMEVVIGGAFQGKREYAKSHFSVKDDEICDCTENEVPDFRKRCLCHVERYIKGCLLRGDEAETDFEGNTILIFDDIFCGIVPLDALERRWREAVGMYLQNLVRNANANLTRVVCGIGMRVK